MGPVYAKYQLASKLRVCSRGFFPVLFNFRPKSSELWIQDVVALSGVTEGRVDGVEFLAEILKDGAKNNSASSISIPKHVVLRDKCKLQFTNGLTQRLTQTQILKDQSKLKTRKFR